MSGLDHLGISTSDYRRSRAFYEAALAPLGIKPMMEFDDPGREVTGFGSDHPFFWVSVGGAAGGRVHVAFRAASRSQVDAFHQAALAAGGADNGAPGLREHYHPAYYGAFVLDPDGYNIEAVCHAPE
ncbi:VOC family protein [Phreatobacter sp. AB_2022a]|uniref:VOC family protein n=1 Tax=Phreatobacter sp. AB_2022a TaxID=3003134 RepID=UPI002286D248|nr:VOC family protein [Phreatobacter sp. AB_2022a]MCZ0738074.1 VOC family protein [Phreatobacter sp. AB_2022a]